jgi:hypothetical protein
MASSWRPEPSAATIQIGVGSSLTGSLTAIHSPSGDHDRKSWRTGSSVSQ